MEAEQPSTAVIRARKAARSRSATRSAKPVPKSRSGADFRYDPGMAPVDTHPTRGLDLGYARVSTTKQSLERQLNALTAPTIPDDRIFTDQNTAAPLDHP